jgi:hypothetical protein
MPTRKQRRRRAKERRHDYEYVYVDEEGNEVEVEEDGAPSTSPGAKKEKRAAPATRAGRVVEPPSWSKVGRRGLIFAPLMFLTVRLLEKGEPLGASLGRTAFLLAIFLPFSFLMDALIYRSYRRRMDAGKR